MAISTHDFISTLSQIHPTSNETNVGGWTKVVYPKAFAIHCTNNKIPFYGIVIKGYDPSFNDKEQSYLNLLINKFDLKLICQNFGEENYGLESYDYDLEPEEKEEQERASISEVVDNIYAKYDTTGNEMEMLLCFWASKVSHKIYINIVTTNKEHLEFISETQKKLNKKAPPKDNKGKINVLTSSYEGLATQELSMAAVPLELTNYNKVTQEGIAHIVKELKSPLPTGRLVILEGEPGTGKTFLVRSLIKEVKSATFIIVPSGMVGRLSDPSIIPVFMEFKKKKIPSEERIIEKMSSGGMKDDIANPIVLVIEDADQCLLTRNANNMDTISTILNLTSGILGDAIDIRIIATTNSHMEDLDKAIIRDGRMSTHVQVGNLSPDEATVVYRRILKDENIVFPVKDDETEISLATVYKTAKKYAKGISRNDETQDSEADRFLVKRKKKNQIGFNQ